MGDKKEKKVLVYNSEAPIVLRWAMSVIPIKQKGSCFPLRRSYYERKEQFPPLWQRKWLLEP